MLTIALIVKNEAHQIPRLFKEFALLDPHWLFLDTGSTDKTIDTVVKEGGKILHTKWNDDFSAARNEVLEQVTTPWVMMIDADYSIRQEDLTKLHHFLQNHHQDLDLIETRSEFNGACAIHPRLWKTAHQLRYRYPVHEYLEVPEGLSLGFCDVVLSATEESDYHKSRERYVQIMEDFLHDHPEDLRMLFYMIADLFFLQDFSRLAVTVQQYLELNPPDEEEVARVLVFMGRALRSLGQLEKAKNMLSAARDLHPQNNESLLVLGDICYQEGLYEEALQMYQEAESTPLPENTKQYINTQHYDVAPLRGIAFAQSQLGKNRDALEVLEKIEHSIPLDEELRELKQSLLTQT